MKQFALAQAGRQVNKAGTPGQRAGGSVNHILLIGLGSIGRRHLTNLADRFPGARFTVMRHAARPDPLCDRLNARIVTRLEDVLSDYVDLVVVATPSANHIDTLPVLIARGWNMLVEKPVVTSLKDCDRIAAALASAPPAVRAAGFNFRYLPSLQRMRGMILDGGLGTVVRASLTAGLWLPDWRPSQDWRAGYSADAARGGGVELDLVHEIDVARWFFGALSLECARGGRRSSLNLAANDVSAMIFTADEGTLIIQVTLDYVSRKRQRHYEIVGDQASLLWNIDGTLEHLGPQDRQTLQGGAKDFDVAQTYVTMINCLAAAISGDWRNPLQSLEDGLASTRLAIAARDIGTRR